MAKGHIIDQTKTNLSGFVGFDMFRSCVGSTVRSCDEMRCILLKNASHSRLLWIEQEATRNKGHLY